MKWIQLSILSVALLSPAAFGQSFWHQKAEIKKASRWTLDEWLATKSKMKWSDLWLTFNSPTPYEFFILGAWNTAAPSGSTRSDLKYGLGAYAQAIGLEFDREAVAGNGWNARFHIRVFGTNIQNTNLNFHIGLRQRSEPVEFRQVYWGTSLTLYLQKYFGLFGQYRYYFNSNGAGTLGTVKGNRFEYGAFIDFVFVRIFVNQVSELEWNDGATAYGAAANGWMFGTQIFF